MPNPEEADEIQRRLQRIQQLATEIEQVPNFGVDVWTMQGIDKKCQEIRGHCQRISALVGTGSGLSGTGPGSTGTGYGGTGSGRSGTGSGFGE